VAPTVDHIERWNWQDQFFIAGEVSNMTVEWHTLVIPSAAQLNSVNQPTTTCSVPNNWIQNPAKRQKFI